MIKQYIDACTQLKLIMSGSLRKPHPGIFALILERRPRAYERQALGSAADWSMGH